MILGHTLAALGWPEPALVTSFWCTSLMHGKRQLPYDVDQIPAARRLRENIADLFLRNEVSGQRASSLCQDGQAAGAQHLDDLVGRRPGRGSARNAHRDMLARLGRRSKWPKLYTAAVRIWNPKTQMQEVQNVSFLLPHEMLGAIAVLSDLNRFADRARLTNGAHQHVSEAERSMGPGAPIIPIAMWLDATPCNWDRSESVETISMSFPGAPDAQVRIPVMVFLKKHFCGRDTFDDCLSVVVWSLRCLVAGLYPGVRHDGGEWVTGEQARGRLAGRQLTVRGLLVEVRGDWACMKDVFRLPGWQETAGCCWLCSANHTTRKQCGADAPWRAERVTHFQMLQRWRELGVAPSPLVSAPYFQMRVFQLDWLHIMDIGVGCDFLGNVFTLLLDHMPGGTKDARAQHLYLTMQEFYHRKGTDTRLDTLTVAMLGPGGKPPKLRARGAEARGLISFAREQADLHFSVDHPEEMAAKQAALLCLLEPSGLRWHRAGGQQPQILRAVFGLGIHSWCYLPPMAHETEDPPHARALRNAYT